MKSVVVLDRATAVTLAVAAAVTLGEAVQHAVQPQIGLYWVVVFAPEIAIVLFGLVTAVLLWRGTRGGRALGLGWAVVAVVAVATGWFPQVLLVGALLVVSLLAAARVVRRRPDPRSG